MPILVTMFLSGLWHGAGYQFIVWGTLHGVFLVINHAWRMLLQAFISDMKRYERLFRPVGLVITLISVFTAMIFFRADNLSIAVHMVASMVGMNGFSIPEGIYVHMGPLKDLLSSIGVVADSTAGSLITYGGIYCVVLLLIAIFLPNSLDMMRNYKPALNYSVKKHQREDLFFNNKLTALLVWRPNRIWAIFSGVALAIGLMSLQKPSVFLYWQF